MLCREVELLLAEYAEDALPAERSAAVSAHLDGCAECLNELSALRRSVAALNAAGRGPTPDLWASFQAQLDQKALPPTCAEIRELLPGFRDGELEPAAASHIRSHLVACVACAREEQLLSESLVALQSAAAAPVPDLWPQFTQRLAATVGCQEVEELLPAVLADEPVVHGMAVRQHIETCAACAESAAALAGALTSLDRVARALPEVDLWPAFAERLRAERERPSVGRRWAQAAGTALQWLRGPLRQPALGFAAFAVIALLGQYLTAPARRAEIARLVEPRDLATAPASPAPQSATAVKTTIEPVETAPEKTGTERLTENPRSTATRARRDKSGRRLAKAAPLPATPSVPSSEPAPAVSPQPAVRVAFNLPAPGGDHGDVPSGIFSVTSPGATLSADQISEKEGMAAVVQAVEILAGREDALHRPFDAYLNE